MEISRQEVSIYQFLKDQNPVEWFDNHEVAEGSGVNERTTRAKTKKFVDVGLFEEARTFPGYRYRLNRKLSSKANQYAKELERMAEVFGVNAKVLKKAASLSKRHKEELASAASAAHLLNDF